MAKTLIRVVEWKLFPCNIVLRSVGFFFFCDIIHPASDYPLCVSMQPEN